MVMVVINIKNILFKFIIILSLFTTLSDYISFADSRDFFDRKSNKLINNDFSDLLSITGIKSKEKCLNSIVDVINDKKFGWLRNGERWKKQTDKFNNNKNIIYDLASKLGYINKIEATSGILYDRALILGATSSVVQVRMESMIQSWNNGTRWKVIVMLGSDRSLDKPESDRSLVQTVVSKNYPKTELGMMKYFYYDKYFNHLPKALQRVPVLFINAKKPANKARADTADTIKEWLKVEKLNNIKSILAFSNQPYIAYQDKVIKYIMQVGGYSSIKVDTVGSQASSTISPIVVLDSIARDLYMLKKMEMS